MKTMIYKINWLLVIFITTNCNINAQCSEAENATMKKYAELTRTGDTQACSQCAWLANLFCIAENGLYKNDKTEVQNAIDATKQNIKLMGDPICCPELLTKSPKFGQPKTAGQQANASETQNKTVQNIQDFANEVNSAISTMENLNAINKTGEQLQNDLEKIEKLMNENSLMSDREYQSEEDVNDEYNIKLANLNKLTATHLDLKTKIQNLGYATAGELMNNPNTTGLGVFAAFGAVVSTDKKESKAFSENAKNSLQSSKSDKLFKQKYKNTDFQIDLIENKMNEYFSKSYPEDFTGLLNNSVIKGYKAGMKYKEFKKLFPKFKWKYLRPAYYQIKDYGDESDFYFKLGLTKGDYSTVREVQQVTTYDAIFSPEKLKEYQQKILDEIKFYDNIFNLKPLSYTSSKADAGYSKAISMMKNMSQEDLRKTVKASNPNLSDQETSLAIQMMGSLQNAKQNNPVNSTTRVSWSDNVNKMFTLQASLVVKNDKITLTITKADENIQPLKFD